MLLSYLALKSGVRLAPISIVDYCFPASSITDPPSLPSPPLVSISSYPSPSFSIPLPFPPNLSSSHLSLGLPLLLPSPLSVSALFVNLSLSFCPCVQCTLTGSSLASPETYFHVNLLPQLLLPQLLLPQLLHSSLVNSFHSRNSSHPFIFVVFLSSQ